MAKFQNRFPLHSSVEKFAFSWQIETVSFGVTLNTKYMYRMVVSIVGKENVKSFRIFHIRRHSSTQYRLRSNRRQRRSCSLLQGNRVANTHGRTKSTTRRQTHEEDGRYAHRK